MKLEETLTQAQVDLKLYHEQLTSLVGSRREELLLTFTARTGIFQSGIVTLEPEIGSYIDRDLAIYFHYIDPEGYKKELMTAYFLAIDEDGEQIRWSNEKATAGYKFERLSFYSTSGWDEVEQARCILIGKVVDRITFLEEELTQPMFEVINRFEEAIKTLNKEIHDRERIIQSAERELDQIEFNKLTHVGIRYEISETDAKLGEPIGTHRPSLETGYGKWDYIRAREGMVYEIVRETPTKYEFKLTTPATEAVEEHAIFNHLIKKNKVNSFIRRLDQEKKITLTPIL